MKAYHYLQVSSAIIGKHRYRSDVTGMTTSIYTASEVVVRDNDCGKWDKKDPSLGNLVSSNWNRVISNRRASCSAKIEN